MRTWLESLLLAFLVVLGTTAEAWSQVSAAPDRVVVSYPSKSITSFPILETAQRRGFFRRENLDVSAVYMRGGIDIKAVITGDADFRHRLHHRRHRIRRRRAAPRAHEP